MLIKSSILIIPSSRNRRELLCDRMLFLTRTSVHYLILKMIKGLKGQFIQASILFPLSLVNIVFNLLWCHFLIEDKPFFFFRRFTLCIVWNTRCCCNKHVGCIPLEGTQSIELCSLPMSPFLLLLFPNNMGFCTFVAPLFTAGLFGNLEWETKQKTSILYILELFAFQYV